MVGTQQRRQTQIHAASHVDVLSCPEGLPRHQLKAPASPHPLPLAAHTWTHRQDGPSVPASSEVAYWLLTPPPLEGQVAFVLQGALSLPALEPRRLLKSAGGHPQTVHPALAASPRRPQPPRTPTPAFLLPVEAGLCLLSLLSGLLFHPAVAAPKTQLAPLPWESFPQCLLPPLSLHIPAEGEWRPPPERHVHPSLWHELT